MTTLPFSSTIWALTTSASDRSTTPVPSDTGSVETGPELEIVLVWTWVDVVDEEVARLVGLELVKAIEVEVELLVYHKQC